MANTRRASFRLGQETERKLEELAELYGTSRTELVRSLISTRYTEVHPVKEEKIVGADPAQMILDDILYHELELER